MEESRKRKRSEADAEPTRQKTKTVPAERATSAPQSPVVKIFVNDAHLVDTPKARKVMLKSHVTPKQRPNERSPSLRTPTVDNNFNVAKKGTKTPSSAKRTPKGGREKVQLQWCWQCDGRALAACRQSGHECVGVQEARGRAALELSATQDRLRRLEELEVRGARVRLRCTMEVEGVGARDVELALSAVALSEADLRALSLYLEGLELQPEQEHLSASSAGCEAIAPRCAKLPDRLDGVTLMPGAVLLLGSLDRFGEEDEDANRSWFGESPPALRIYYDRPVSPQQGRGSKVLGYITSNLKHVASARPCATAASDSDTTDDGRAVRIINVLVISD